MARGRTFLARLASNTVIGFFGNALQRAFAFTVTLILARGLGENGFGLYSYVVSYMFLFAFLADLGVERVVTRAVSQTPALAGELVGSALVVKLALSVGAMAAAIGTAFVVGMEGDALRCVILAAIGLPMTLEHVFRGYFQSRYQAVYTYLITMPGTVWFLAGAILAIRFHWPVYALFAWGLAIAPFVVVALFWTSRYRLHLVLRPRWARMRSMLRESTQLGGFIFLFMLAMRIDQVMLHHLRGDVEVGLYAVGVRLSEALALIPEAALLTLFPLLVSTQHAAPERFHHTVRLGFKYLSGIGVLMAFGITALRHEVIDLLFGPAYEPSETALAILAWNMFFGYIGVIYLSLFVAQSRHRLLLFVSAGALLVDVVLNFVWIPQYGASGAAAATLVANIAGFAAWLALPDTRPYMVTCLRESSRALAAAAFTAVTLWASSLDGVAAAVVVLGLYPALLWAFGGVRRSDIALLQRLFAEPNVQPAP